MAVVFRIDWLNVKLPLGSIEVAFPDESIEGVGLGENCAKI